MTEATSPYLNRPLRSLAEAARVLRQDAVIYRGHASRAPRNSKTRQHWLRLAEAAEATASLCDRNG